MLANCLVSHLYAHRCVTGCALHLQTMLTLLRALEQLAIGTGRSFSSSSIKWDAILAEKKYLIILLSRYHWWRLAFVLHPQSKFSIYHSQDKRFSSISSTPAHLKTPNPSLLWGQLRCLSEILMSNRTLLSKTHSQLPPWLLFSTPLFSPAFFFTPPFSLWCFSSAPSQPLRLACPAWCISVFLPQLLQSLFLLDWMFTAAFPTASQRPAWKPRQLSSTHFAFPVSLLTEKPVVSYGCPFCRPSSALQLCREYNHSILDALQFQVYLLQLLNFL